MRNHLSRKKCSLSKPTFLWSVKTKIKSFSKSLKIKKNQRQKTESQKYRSQSPSFHGHAMRGYKWITTSFFFPFSAVWTGSYIYTCWYLDLLLIWIHLRMIQCFFQYKQTADLFNKNTFSFMRWLIDVATTSRLCKIATCTRLS
jgi:hypothetical protein